MKLKFFLPLLVISVPLYGQNNYDTVRIRPQKITESIYMLKGIGGNMGLLLGSDGSLLIDDQFAPLSEKIKSAVQALGGGEVKLLINTHIHGDHSGGNENFRKWGVIIFAHDQVRERMMQLNNSGELSRDKDAWPVVTFPGRANIHWGNDDLELIHVGPGHTDGDVIIYFTRANVVHTGDLFVRYGYPFIDRNNGGSINGFINNVNKILDLTDDNTRVIPGHGELATKKDVLQFRDRLVELRDAVQQALNKGTRVEEVANLQIASKYDAEWGGGFIKGKEFVLLIAEDLVKK